MGKDRGKKRQREADDVAAVAGDGAVRAEEAEAPKAKKARIEPNRSLFVRSLPATATADSLTEFFSQHFPVKHAMVVLDPKTKTSRGYGFVTFTDPEDALEAKQKLNNELLGGRRLHLDIAEARQRDSARSAASSSAARLAEGKQKREEALAEAKRPPKLIIRNLPWSIKTPEQLTHLFRSFGKVRFADLPQDKGKLSGFGFVTLRGRKNAEKAMEAINGKVIDGRTLAVDWAVDKGTWQRQQGKDEPEEGAEKTQDGPGSKKQKRQKKASDSASAGEDAKPNGKSQEDWDLENFFKDHMENLESEGEDGPEATDEDDENSDKASEESGEEDEDEIEDEDDESNLEEEEEEEGEEQSRKLTDNSTTIFVRNLPYTATNETLKIHFTKFGPVRYARVVMERATDRPAGTGFVCFVNSYDFKACLKAAPRHRPLPALGKHSVLQDESIDKDGRYTLDGRVLQVAQAVSQEEATRLAATGPGHKGQDKDKRRLFLLSEGAIPASSPLFSKMAASEIKMREDSAKQRKKLIQSNPALHLSLTRLALRNIPRHVGSRELKALAREAIVGFAKDVRDGRRQPLSKEERARGGQEDKDSEHRRKEKRKGVVSQAKVVFETKEGSKVAEGAGAGKSRGYGFVEYSSHRWALMGLRWLNGHALDDAAGKARRLIAEFAIENANVVQRRRRLGEGKNKLGPRQKGPRQQERSHHNHQAGRGGGALGRGGGGGGGGEGQEGEMKNKKHVRKGGRDGGNDGKEGEGKSKMKSAKGKKGREEEPAAIKTGKKDADEKLAARSRIIARKRQLRKMKRGKPRGGN